MVWLSELERSGLDKSCREHGLWVEEDFKKAHDFVVDDVSNVRMRVLWPSLLGGCYICDVEYMLSEGAKGTMLKFKAATAIKRTMHLTPSFATAHEEMALVLLHYSSACSPKSNWRYCDNEARFLEVAAKANAAKKPTSVIVFLTEADVPRFAGVRLQHTASSALESFFVLDRQRCASGLLGVDERWQSRREGSDSSTGAHCA